MARFRFEIEYEGTRFSGWQIQKDARTIQGEFFNALEKIFETNDFEFYGAGRTDSGVHALGQVAHLDVKTMLAPHIIKMKVNDELPHDINVLNCSKAEASFHARYHAVGRSYVYVLSRRRSAFGKRMTWWVRDNLDISEMKLAAALFEGEHDFISFTADDPGKKSTRATILKFTIQEEGDLVVFRVLGNRFAWKQVRRMIGALVEVGRKTISPLTISQYLAERSDGLSRFTAPPAGLFLERVFFDQKDLNDSPKKISLPNFL